MYDSWLAMVTGGVVSTGIAMGIQWGVVTAKIRRLEKDIESLQKTERENMIYLRTRIHDINNAIQGIKMVMVAMDKTDDSQVIKSLKESLK